MDPMRRFVVVMGLAACGDNLHVRSDATPPSGDAASILDAASDAAADAGVDATIAVCCDEGQTSGTRLKLVWYVTQDGVKTWPGTQATPGFHDAQRGEDCWPDAWSDGNTYCTPFAMQAVYADSSCTTPLGQVQPSSCGSAPPPFDYIADTGGCAGAPAITHFYQRGAQVAVAQFYTKSAAGACSGPSTGSYTFYAAGAEVDPSALVQMTAGAPEGTGTLQLEWWQTADGLRAVERAHDTTLDVDCVPTTLFSTTPLCYPRSASPSVVFADSACTTRDVGVASCQTPKFATVTDQSCAKPIATFYAIGAQIAPSALYWLDGTPTCRATGVNPADTYYSVGAQITPTAVQYQADTTPGRRLELYHFTSTDFSFRNANLYDTTYGADCQLEKLVDGSVVCLPIFGSPTVVSAFRDAACTQPIALANIHNYSATATCPTAATNTLALAWDRTDPCKPVPEVRTVGALYTQPVYLQSGAYCYDATSSRDTYYEAPAIVPISSLATATRYVDP